MTRMHRRLKKVSCRIEKRKTLDEAPILQVTGPALGTTMLVVSFYLLAALLVSVYGAEALSLFSLSQITAAENPLTGRVAEVRLLQKL